MSKDIHYTCPPEFLNFICEIGTSNMHAGTILSFVSGDFFKYMHVILLSCYFPTLDGCCLNQSIFVFPIDSESVQICQSIFSCWMLLEQIIGGTAYST